MHAHCLRNHFSVHCDTAAFEQSECSKRGLAGGLHSLTGISQRPVPCARCADTILPHVQADAT